MRPTRPGKPRSSPTASYARTRHCATEPIKTDKTTERRRSSLTRGYRRHPRPPPVAAVAIGDRFELQARSVLAM